jgi:hypothetical protein
MTLKTQVLAWDMHKYMEQPPILKLKKNSEDQLALVL